MYLTEHHPILNRKPLTKEDRQEKNLKKWKEALAKQDTQEARKYAMRSSKLSPYIIESSKSC